MTLKPNNYEALKAEVRSQQQAGKLPKTVSSADRADWAYGNAVIENDNVTREMAEKAARRDGSER
jgi:hypothetical protein